MPQAAGQNPAPAGQPAAAASAPSGGSGEWVVALAEEAATLDPLYGQSTAGSTLAQSHIYDTLVGYEDRPTWAQVLAYVGFVGGFGGWYALSLRARHVASPPHHEGKPPIPPTR